MQDRSHKNTIVCAIENRDIALIKKLVQSGIDLTIPVDENRTPIKYAEKLGYWNCVEAIAQSRTAGKSNAHDPDDQYGSVLLSAVEAQLVDTVRILLKANSPVNWNRPTTGYNVLHLAVLNNNIEIVKLLLLHDSYLINKKDKDKKTAIELAAEHNHWAVVDYIALHCNDKDGEANFGSALVYAIQADRLTTVKYLLDANATLNWRSIASKNSPLHEAVINNNISMITLLLQYGANSSKMNINNQTPIELACHLGHWDCAKQLMNGKQFTFVNRRGSSKALIQAVRASQYQLVSYLIKAGAVRSELSKEDSNSPLHIAVNQNDMTLVKLLYKDGRIMTCCNQDGKTAIELASEKQQWKMVEFFLKAEIDIDKHDIQQFYNKAHYKQVLLNSIKYNNYYIADHLLKKHISCDETDGKHGYIALYYAIKHNNVIMLSLLLSYGANPEIRNSSGQSMYDLAFSQDDKRCYELLIEHQKTHCNTSAECDKMVQYLQSLQDDLMNKSWKVKDSLLHWSYDADWKEGIPKHVIKMLNTLKIMKTKDMTKDMTNPEVIFNIYDRLLSILYRIKPSSCRHPETMQFYKEKKRELIDLISRQSILRATTSYCVMNQFSPVSLQAHLENIPYQNIVPLKELIHLSPSYQETISKIQATNIEAVNTETLPVLSPTHLYPVLPDTILYGNSTVSSCHTATTNPCDQLISLPTTLPTTLPTIDNTLSGEPVKSYDRVTVNTEGTINHYFPEVPKFISFFPPSVSSSRNHQAILNDETVEKPSIMNKTLALVPS
jgi:ankyrin repeat protein